MSKRLFDTLSKYFSTVLTSLITEVRSQPFTRLKTVHIVIVNRGVGFSFGGAGSGRGDLIFQNNTSTCNVHNHKLEDL